ncbi:FAD dependent oxidoreductase [Roridomyces roridus]|uniref:FAD dependent oxidoreductase n=1 Tax=Roridomyces roridus TaxID=1738132 RepID=A0AAD7B7Y9_9AGAR|nr:FAD dependent oxidoreductase [Roridomyces roridus]
MEALPGYPHPNPCLSFWLMGARNSPLIGHRTTDTLPEHADVTIIGSGLSGTAIAYFLLTGPNPPKRVVLLEAREACDGATARNGGHCRPEAFIDYAHYKHDFGKEQATKIIRNEFDTLDLVTEIIEKEGVDCDFWRGFSYAVATDQPSADTLAVLYQEFVNDGGNVEGIVEQILGPEAARRATRCANAFAAYKSPTGSLWPHKLVIHLLSLCIEKHGLNLQTHTPVRAVSSNSDGSWSVQTDRGVVRTDKVVYATNAFTATLLPEFLGHIWPFKGQCSVVVPPKAFSGTNMLQQTYGLVYEEDTALRADYMIQRQKDGLIIFGGRRGAASLDKLLGNTNDSEIYPEMSAALKKALPAFFEGWEEQVEGEGQLHVWSGIMGYTTEGVPYVGELHDKPGAFICAGHQGHGMARIMTCAKGVAQIIQGESWASTGLPECFQPTHERLAKPAGVHSHAEVVEKLEVVDV